MDGQISLEHLFTSSLYFIATLLWVVLLSVYHKNFGEAIINVL